MAKLGSLVAAFVLIVSSFVLPLQAGVEANPGWEQGGLTEDALAIAVDLRDDRIVYATGPSGLWKSTNGGETWSLVSPEKIAQGLALDAKNPSTIYAAGNRSRGGGGIYKSTDGGKNWSIVRTGESPSVIVVDPINTTIVYAGVSINNNYEILKSTDAGASWSPILRPAGSQSPGIGSVTALALSPSKPNIIYAGLSGYHSGDVLRSDDGGSVWRSVASSGRYAPLMAPSAIVVDPQNPDVVYVGWALMGYKKFFMSVDGGASWKDLSATAPQGGSALSSLIIDPDSGTLIAAVPGTVGGLPDGQPGGVYFSYDAGSRWFEPEAAGADKPRVALAAKSRVLYAAGRSGVSFYRLGYRLDPRFQAYYDSHDGLRVLGSAISRPLVVNGYSSQYFEKGRIEDHGEEVVDPNWKLMYGLLVDELQAAKASLPVGGEASSITYAGIYDLARPTARIAPPAGFAGGVSRNEDGSVFLPYHPELKVEAGHNVPKLFWDYLNRGELFSGGWLHDIGLPMTEAVWAKVDKGDMKGRDVLIQAFQRTVLTYDPANPADWQVERANIGTDYQKRFP